MSNETTATPATARSVPSRVATAASVARAASADVLTPDAPLTDKKPVRTTPRATMKLGDLLRVEPKKENGMVAQAAGPEHTEAFTADALQTAWDEFAVTKRQLQAEFHLLAQPYDLEGTRITLHLLSPVQETMLNGFRSDLISFLRMKLRNDTIQVTGAIRQSDEKKMIYTPRDKFEYLQEKMPILKEFKDRLGLDTDF